MQTALLLLWSTNERAAGRLGIDVAEPDTEWMNDLMGLDRIDAEDPRETTESLLARALGLGGGRRVSRNLNDIED